MLLFFAPQSLELPPAGLLRLLKVLALRFRKLDSALNEAFHPVFSLAMVSRR